MSLPKEPRQLMINLMYLVLTALLAMNVSSEILNAFKTIGKSISNSNKAVESRNELFSGEFQKFLDDPKASPEKKKKVSDAMGLVEQVNNKTKALVAQIESYKEMIIQASGGRDDKGEIKRIDDLDGGTRVMIEEGNGAKFLEALKTFKTDIAGLVPIDDKVITAPGNGASQEIYKNLPLDFSVTPSEENKNSDWSYYNFHMSPTIANVTLLDKYISDVRASQAMALDQIWAKATGERREKPFVNPKVFNEYAIIVSADNNYVLPGEKFHARIMMGTYNKNLKNLSFQVNGQNVNVVDGVADYSTIAPTAIGPKTINVTARFNDTITNENGEKVIKPVTVTLPKPVQYFVGESQASISLDKMNVFYVGVDNPITISASGIPAGSISPVTENCTLTKTGGVNQYIVRPTKAGTKAKISLVGTLADGSKKTFDPFEYRVKNIPDPYPVIAGKRGGQACANELRVQQAVFAKLDAFDFDVKFEVVSFDVFYTPKRGEPLEGTSKSFYLNGPNADPSVRSVMDALKPGGKLYFDNIRVKMPDGRIRNIGSVVYVINC
jgi:gliding motility-associated protein GldM